MKLSIITVCRNSEATIECTMESVARQSYPNIEHIVIDGASTDATMDIVSRYPDRTAAVVSEPDGGIAEAMNKGWMLATGDQVLFLHADDYLVDQAALERIVPLFDEKTDIHAFDIYFETRNGRQRRRPRGDDWRLNFKTGFYHQAVWFRKNLPDIIGLYDTQFRITMDYEYFLRSRRLGATIRYVPEVFSVMRDTGISSRKDWPTVHKRLRDERNVHSKLQKNIYQSLLYNFYWTLYFPYRRLRHM